MIGTKLGPYEIREEVGRGGMAVVYRAYQPNIDRDVAIKVITKGLADDPNAAQRFQREARLIARLEHAHILPVYDFDGRHTPSYIVMRYLDGGTLKNIMQLGILPFAEINHLMKQIGSALDYAHHQGIVHRDIKPSNILIDRDGNAYVTDFGIARMVSGNRENQITASGAVMGTPDYMSPEQAQGDNELDHRADIYSLGVILFRMLTDTLPYKADSAMKVIMQHITEPVPSAIERNSELPAEIDKMLFKALAKEPNERYASAADLADATAKALGGLVSNQPTALRKAAEKTISQRQLQANKAGTKERTPSEQNKIVTVLASNATEYAEIVMEEEGSEAARQALAHLWQTAVTLVEKHGGKIVSQSEEDLQAIWGAEIAHENDAERAVRTALALQDELRNLATPYLEEDELLPFNIGLHSGVALLTITTKGSSVSASGTAVSFANRLVRQADGVILITHDVYTQVRGVFDIERDGSLKLRRSRTEIPTYRVTATKARSFRQSIRGVEGVETAMIGRLSELTTLQNAFMDALEEQETRFITLISEAGLGKSRLLYEYNNWHDLRPEEVWLIRGRATPQMSHRPYALLRELLSFRYEILDDDPPALVREKLEKGIENQIGSEIEMAHLLGYLAGFDMSSSYYVKPLKDDPQQLTNRAKLLFRRWIAALCQTNAGVVIELEDLHYADDSSLDLLTELVALHDDLPLIIVAAARPDLLIQRPTWGSGQTSHKLLHLQPMDRRESRHLVREILQKVDDIPKKLRDLLVERAEGNPYYLEELIKMLIDDRIILKESETHWVVSLERLEQLAVPTTLVGLLQARLDSLLPSEKLVLQRAAVIGRLFYDSALDAINEASDTHVPNIEGVLKKLTESELIYQRETTAFANSIEYIFSSSLLRDVLLATLLKRQVTAYNTAAAQWLIDISGERVDEYYALIAEYFEYGDELQKAVLYYQKAGEVALKTSAYASARQNYEQALNLLTTKDELFNQLQLQLSENLFYLGQFEEMKVVLQDVLKTSRNRQEMQQTAQAYYWLGQVARVTGNYNEAYEFNDKGLYLAKEIKDKVILCQLLYGKADILWRLGKNKEARPAIEESLNLAVKLNNLQLALQVRNRLSTILFGLGLFEESNELDKTILHDAKKNRNLYWEAGILSNMGDNFYIQHDWIKAKEYTKKALPIARELGHKELLSMILLNLSAINIKLNHLDIARNNLFEGLDIAYRNGILPYVLLSCLHTGTLLVKTGDKEYGLALMGLVQHHPASESQTIPQIADDLLFLGLNIDDPTVQSTLDKGKKLELEEVIPPLLDKLRDLQEKL